MDRYWLKIGLGALGVFAAGMVIITAMRTGKDAVVAIAKSDQPITIPLAGMVPFKFNEQRLGTIRSLKLMRDRPNHITEVQVRVRVADSLREAPLASCDIVASSIVEINDKTRFSCAPMDSASLAQLAPFGEVEFSPSGETRTLLASKFEIDKLRRDMAREFKFDSASDGDTDPDPDVTVESAGANIDIRGKDGRQIFSMQADSNGTHMVARDARGNETVRIQADRNGAKVITRDARGRETVRVQADSHGAAVRSTP